MNKQVREILLNNIDAISKLLFLKYVQTKLDCSIKNNQTWICYEVVLTGLPLKFNI